MATRPFDVSKFRKSITKSIDGISVGFNDPTDWISTGSFALNFLISGDFNKGIPLGKVTVFSGESGSGKSFLCSGNVIRNAQAQGIYVILVDTENALDETWLHALGVETTEDKLLKLNMAMIDDVAKVISDFVKEYKTMPEDDRPKVLFVIDSLGMLLTPTDTAQFESGLMKGDMGRKPKALKSLVTNCVNMFGNLNIGLLATNHSYASQDPYSPDPIISGGSGFVYASSIVVGMKKLKLKEDAEGNKVSEVLGIRSGCKVVKSRYSKPFEDIELQIPYEVGMDKYTGMFDLLERKHLITKEGNRYVYIDLSGQVHKYFRKEWIKNENGIYDLVMSEFTEKQRLLDEQARTKTQSSDQEDNSESQETTEEVNE